MRTVQGKNYLVKDVKSSMLLGLHTPSVLSRTGGDDVEESTSSEEEHPIGSDGGDQSVNEEELQEVGVSAGSDPIYTATPLAGPFLLEIESAVGVLENSLRACVSEGASVTDFEREFLQRILRDEGRYPVLWSLFRQGSVRSKTVQERGISPLATGSSDKDSRVRLEKRSRGLGQDGGYREKHLRRVLGDNRQGSMDSYSEFVQGLNADGVLRGRSSSLSRGHSSRYD